MADRWTVTGGTAGNSITLELNATTVVGKLQKLYYAFTKKSNNLVGIMQEVANIGATYAKNNHRWQNQTGDAERGLVGGATWESSTVVTAAVAHSVYYGVYLEYSFQRRYAILEEAIQYAAQQLGDYLKGGVNIALK